MRTTSLGALAACLCALLASTALPAVSVRAGLKMSESLTIRCSKASTSTCIPLTRSAVTAKIELAANPVDVSLFSGATPVEFRLGRISFAAKLGDDPAWKPNRTTARFPLLSSTVAGERVGSVVVRWTTAHVTIQVKASTAAGLTDLPYQTSLYTAYEDAAVRVAADSWYVGGLAKGKVSAHRGVRSARVALSTYIGRPPQDGNPPDVAITDPAYGEILPAMPTRFSGEATDDGAIAQVSWSLDGSLERGLVLVPAPHEGPGQRVTFSFDVSTAVEGNHVVQVTAAADQGNVSRTFPNFTYAIPSTIPLATGDRFTWAIHGGRTYSWGTDAAGQLGNCAAGSQTSPAEVTSLAAAKALAAGFTHTVALMTDGTVRTCGSNAYGQLGDGTRDDSGSPVTVSGLTNVTSVAAGNYHCLALRADGTVWAWGANARGQIGDGTGGTNLPADDRLTPVKVKGLANVRAISAGGDVSMALLADGTLRGWGDGVAGQLPTLGPTLLPVEITDFGDVAEVAVGGVNVIARKSDGTVWAWGLRAFGCIGDGDPSTEGMQTTPSLVSGASPANGIAAGAVSCAAVLTNRVVVAWGNSDHGQAGDDTRLQRSRPAQVGPLDHIARLIGSGQSLTFLAQRTDNVVFAWGEYVGGDPVFPQDTLLPVRVDFP